PTASTDRWLTLAVRNDREWRALVAVIGTPDAADDPRFARAEARRANRNLVNELVSQWLATRCASLTAEQLQNAGVCAHVSWTTQEIAECSHLLQRGALTPVNDPANPQRLAVGTPARFGSTPGVGIFRGTPGLGQDEDYVFGQLLGLSSAQRQDLEEREVIM
ncbi:MAG TPA: CoA transferase, partial [Marinobacter sp.]|nr:CoA transferase [Marinobacter sp.]